MKSIKNLLLLSLAAIAFSGCESGSKRHLAQIDEGMKPRIAVVTHFPDDINISYIGTTVFQNKSLSYALDTDYSAQTDAYAKELVRNSEVVDYAELPSDALPRLEEKLGRSLAQAHQLTPDFFNTDALATIAAWGQDIGADYVLFIHPGYGPNAISGRAGSVLGKGLLVNDYPDGDPTFAFASYRAVLVDSTNADVSQISNLTIFKQISSFKKDKVPQDQIDTITTHWQAEVDRAEARGVGLKPIPLEPRLERARIYQGEDFRSLNAEDLGHIDDRATPLSRINLERHLRFLKLIKGAPAAGRVYHVRPTEKVYRPEYLYLTN